jgi:D-3-phosphoglycerate dehydrogenase
MSALPRVLSTHRLHPSAEARIAETADLRFASALDESTLIREGRESEIIIVRAPLPAAVFADAPSLRAAIRHGAGVDMIPLDAATAAGVLVANVPGANARSVAEYALFAALALARRFRALDGDLRRAGWPAARAHADLTREIVGRTLGLVGFGAVGRTLAGMAAALGLGVLATNRSGRPMPPPVEARDLDTVLAESDILVLACPLTEETRGLIDRPRLALMKPGAILINVARGPVVEEASLVEALATGHLGGAALDVFATQPLPADHAFFRFDNVLLTPHLAGITADSMERMGHAVAEEAARILAGGLPHSFVNPEVEAAYRARFPASAG